MSLPYFPMYPSDFEAKTSHLTLAEDGAYNRLLRICWMTPGCTIPTDETWIMRRARAHTESEKDAVRAVLAEFFTIEKGRYSNAKLMRIWREANEAHEKRKNAGAKGGKAKALKTNDAEPSNAVAKPKQPEPEPEPYKEEVTNVTSRRLASPSDGFEDFWNLWPSKKNKDAARKAWRRLSMDDKRAAYRAVQRGWLDAWQREHPDANPIHASTFLNKRRWEDEPAPSKPTPAKGAQANAKPSITERIFPRDRGMDCGPGRNPSEPLLPPDDGRRDRGSGDDGLDRGALRLVSGTDKRGM